MTEPGRLNHLVDHFGQPFQVGSTASKNGMMQNYGPCMGSFRFWQRAGCAVAAGGAADMKRLETGINGDATTLQRGEELRTCQAHVSGVQLKANLVISWFAILDTVGKQTQPRNVLKQVSQEFDGAEPLGLTLGQTLKLRQQDGGLEFRQCIDQIAAAAEMEFGPLEDVCIPCQQRPAATRAEKLGAAKAENPHVTPDAGGPALDPCSGNLGGILDHGNAPWHRLLQDFPHGYDAAVQM